MEFLLNILLIFFLFGYGIVNEAQLSVRRICGLSAAGGVCENLDLNRYNSEKNALKKSVKIEFIGTNGNHQRILDLIKKINKPFTVVMFDAHSDAKPNPGKIHCGNWVNFAFKENPYLKRIITIGITKGIRFEMAPSWCNYELIKSGKHVIFPALKVRSYFKDSKIPSTVSDLSDKCEFDYIAKFFGSPGYYVLWETPSYDGIRRYIENGDSVYITIDLDVLQGVKTPYGSGKMNISTVSEIIKNLERDYKIYGVDICGTDDISSKADFEEILKCLRK